MKDSAGWNRTRCRAWIDGSPSALSDGTLKVAEPQPADCDVNIDHSRVESAPPSFAIADRRVGADEPVFVIAEVGINHGGDAALCARMMEAAAAAGADAVKLQTIDADESYVKGTLSYNEFNGKEISDEALAGLLRLADRLRLVLFSTPVDFVSLERMTRLGMAAVKISSGLMTNLPLIAAAARQRLPLIISTGLAHETEIAEAVDSAHAQGAHGLALLKCTALYPASDDAINLRALPAMQQRFGVPVGYSDHTLDDLACTAAVALGASVIEKHFTLDNTLPGADHRVSMEPGPFVAMVQRIRRLELMRGDGRIRPVAEEEAVRAERHRCLVARRDIAAGERFTAENVALKRPLPGRVGLSPRYYERVLGCVTAHAMRQDDPIVREGVVGFP